MEKKTKKKIKEKLQKEIGILKDRRGFLKAGFPRFNRLFGRDSLIVSWQLLNIDPEITLKTLEFLIRFQGKKFSKLREEEPGKILHELKGKFPYYGSVDSTLLFLILFSFYFKKTKNIKFLKKYWQNAISAVNWILNYGDKDKDYFLEYKRKNQKENFHQGWKDSFKNHLRITPPVAIVEVQGYQYLALKEIAKISKILGYKKLSQSLLKRAEILKQNFNKKFWMPKKNFYALALNKEKIQRKAITSNPGHLLFTGIIEENKITSVVKRLFQKDLWTPFGIRTHSTKEPDFDFRSYHLGSVWPHDNWIIAKGLKKLGYKKEYRKIKTAMIAAFGKIGFIPEFYGVVDNKITLKMKKPVCHPQAWAAGALLNFLTSL